MGFNLGAFADQEFSKALELDELVTKKKILFVLSNDGKPWFVGFLLSESLKLARNHFSEFCNRVCAEKLKTPGEAILVEGKVLSDLKDRWKAKNPQSNPIRGASKIWVCDWQFAHYYLTTATKEGVDWKKQVQEQLRTEIDLLLKLQVNQANLEKELSNLRNDYQSLKALFDDFIKKQQEKPAEPVRSNVVESSPIRLTLNPFERPASSLEEIAEIPVEGLHKALHSDEIDKDVLLNQLVRKFVLDHNDTDYETVWNKLYSSYKTTYRVDLKRRASNCRPKVSVCQYAKLHGFLDNLYELAKKVLSSEE